MTHHDPTLQVAFSAFARVQEQLPSASFAPSPLAASSRSTEQQNDTAACAKASQQHQVSQEHFLVCAGSKADVHRTPLEQPLLHGSKTSSAAVQPEEEEMNAGQKTAEFPQQQKEGSEILTESSFRGVIEDVFEFPAQEHSPPSSLIVQKPAGDKPRNMGSTAAKVGRRNVQKAPAAHPGSSDHAIKQKCGALKRKRIDSRCKAASSDSEMSLECSEVFSESVAEMSDSESESKSVRRSEPKATVAKRTRLSTKKGLTVAQLKQRCSLATPREGCRSDSADCLLPDCLLTQTVRRKSNIVQGVL